jgi:hypothetical protein
MSACTYDVHTYGTKGLGGFIIIQASGQTVLDDSTSESDLTMASKIADSTPCDGLHEHIAGIRARKVKS